MRHLYAMLCLILLGTALVGCGEVDDAGEPAIGGPDQAQSEECVTIDRAVHIETAADLSGFSGLSCFDITESLSIVRTDVTTLDGLEGLRSVEGFVTIYDNPNLQDASALASLESVGFQLDVGHNPGLVELPLLSLERVDGHVRIFGNYDSRITPGMEHISLPALTHVEGDLHITGNWRLRLLEIDSLIEVANDLIVSHHTDLPILQFSRLETVGGSALILDNRRGLRVIGLPSLRTVGEDFVIRRHSDLVRFIVPTLEQVGGDFAIKFNRSLPECDATSLADRVQIGGEQQVLENDYLAFCPQDTCTVVGDVIVEDAGDIAELGATGCTRIGGDLQIIGTSLPDLSGLENLRVVEGELFIRENEQLQSLAGLENLEVPLRLWVENNPQLVDLSGLESLEFTHFLMIRGNESLERLDGLESLESAGRLIIENNPSLVSLEALGELRETHRVVIRANQSLASLAGLENIERIEGNSAFDEGTLVIEANPSLTSLDGLASLVRLRGDLRIIDNVALPTCEALALLDQLQRSSGVISGNLDTGPCP